MALLDLRSEGELDAVFRAPAAVLLKHGASCPISAAAREELSALAAERPDLPIYGVEVTGRRALSDAVAGRLGVAHESPQAFVLRDGHVVWCAEHFDITRDAMVARLA